QHRAAAHRTGFHGAGRPGPAGTAATQCGRTLPSGAVAGTPAQPLDDRQQPRRTDERRAPPVPGPGPRPRPAIGGQPTAPPGSAPGPAPGGRAAGMRAGPPSQATAPARQLGPLLPAVYRTGRTALQPGPAEHPAATARMPPYLSPALRRSDRRVLFPDAHRGAAM